MNKITEWIINEYEHYKWAEFQAFVYSTAVANADANQTNKQLETKRKEMHSFDRNLNYIKNVLMYSSLFRY
jgi:hypothetical protein